MVLTTLGVPFKQIFCFALSSRILWSLTPNFQLKQLIVRASSWKTRQTLSISLSNLLQPSINANKRTDEFKHDYRRRDVWNKTKFPIRLKAEVYHKGNSKDGFIWETKINATEVWWANIFSMMVFWNTNSQRWIHNFFLHSGRNILRGL